MMLIYKLQKADCLWQAYGEEFINLQPNNSGIHLGCALSNQKCSDGQSTVAYKEKMCR